MESVAVAREWPRPLRWSSCGAGPGMHAQRMRDAAGVALSYAERGGARRPCAPRSIGSGGLPTSSAGAGAWRFEGGMATVDATAVTGEHVGMSSEPTCAGTEAEGICRQLQSGQLSPGRCCSGVAGAQHSWLAGMDAAVACRSTPIHAQCACSSGMSNASKVARLINRARGRSISSPGFASTAATCKGWTMEQRRGLASSLPTTYTKSRSWLPRSERTAKPDNLSAGTMEWQVTSAP